MGYKDKEQMCILDVTLFFVISRSFLAMWCSSVAQSQKIGECKSDHDVAVIKTLQCLKSHQEQRPQPMTL